MMTRSLASKFVGLAAFAVMACSKSETETATCEVDTSYHPTIVPADFSTAITNPFLPIVPGTTRTFSAGDQTVVVEVTSKTKVIMGVTCVEVRDTKKAGTTLLEDTTDWYAQDSAGNVWYFGEQTAEYENGAVVSTAGTWTAGVGGAQPGIVMLATPRVGDVYRQEYLACEAEDTAEVVALGETVTVPLGTFTDCVRTRDYTILELVSNEYKWYCRGIGQVASVNLWNADREQLVAKTP
jgi:hypothetical protein